MHAAVMVASPILFRESKENIEDFGGRVRRAIDFGYEIGSPENFGPNISAG
jgi:hypothetical protein